MRLQRGRYGDSDTAGSQRRVGEAKKKGISPQLRYTTERSSLSIPLVLIGMFLWTAHVITMWSSPPVVAGWGGSSFITLIPDQDASCHRIPRA